MRRDSFRFVLLLVSLTLLLSACGVAAPASTATPTTLPPTGTPEPTATLTPLPSDTPQPTITPDVAATQRAEDFQSLLALFHKKGYIGSVDGQVTLLHDWKKEFAKLHDYFKWGFTKEAEGEYSNFVFSAHFEWRSYSSTPDVSGCGLGFGIKENDDHYVIFLDRENLVLLRGRGTRLYRMGTAGGDRYPTIPIPARSDFAVAVWDQNVTVSVDGVIVNYILSSDQNAQGKIAYSLLSGTNSGYGTRCEMTDIILWTPK